MDISYVAKKILDVTRRALRLDLVKDETGEFKYMPSALKTSRGDRSIKITMMMEHSIKNFGPMRQPVYVTVEIPTVSSIITSGDMSRLTVKIEDSNTWPHKFNTKERVAVLQASLRLVSIKSRSRSRSRSKSKSRSRSRNRSRKSYR
jgi:hypothetical protein